MVKPPRRWKYGGRLLDVYNIGGPARQENG
jgi:hypothetical protein